MDGKGLRGWKRETLFDSSNHVSPLEVRVEVTMQESLQFIKRLIQKKRKNFR